MFHHAQKARDIMATKHRFKVNPQAFKERRRINLNAAANSKIDMSHSGWFFSRFQRNTFGNKKISIH